MAFLFSIESDIYRLSLQGPIAMGKDCKFYVNDKYCGIEKSLVEKIIRWRETVPYKFSWTMKLN